MPDAQARTQRQQATQIAFLVLTFAVLLNAAFYFLSDLYFADRAKRFGAHEALAINTVRLTFGMFSLAVGVGSVAAAFSPKLVGHGVALGAGLMSLVAAVFAMSSNLPGTLAVALLVVGAVFPVLVWQSLARSRAAWSFLIALTGVYAVVLLFGAPKVRGLVGIGLWHALIIPGVLAVGTVALAMLRADYREALPPGTRAAPAPAPAPAEALDPEQLDKRRKAGIRTMSLGLALLVVGAIAFGITAAIGMSMASAFINMSVLLGGVVMIVGGYLQLPRR